MSEEKIKKRKNENKKIKVVLILFCIVVFIGVAVFFVVQKNGNEGVKELTQEQKILQNENEYKVFQEQNETSPAIMLIQTLYNEIQIGMSKEDVSKKVNISNGKKYQDENGREIEVFSYGEASNPAKVEITFSDNKVVDKKLIQK